VDLFVVDLDETAADQMRLRCIVFGHRYDLTECSWDYAFRFLVLVAAHHRMGFAAPRLPVCKDSPIVAVEHTFNQSEGALLVDETLSCIGREDEVKGKTFGLFFDLFAHKVNLIIFGVDLDDADTA
jgi:hypothetical protein